MTNDPLLNVDLVEGELVHWTFDAAPYDPAQLAFAFQRSLVRGAPRLHDEASEEAFDDGDELVEGFLPATPEPTAAKALRPRPHARAALGDFARPSRP